MRKVGQDAAGDMCALRGAVNLVIVALLYVQQHYRLLKWFKEER